MEAAILTAKWILLWYSSIEFVVLSSLDCAQIGFPLMRGELLRYGLRTEETNLGLAGSLSPFRMCTYRYAMLSGASSAQASSTYSNLESADMDSLYVELLKTYVNAYAIKM